MTAEREPTHASANAPRVNADHFTAVLREQVATLHDTSVLLEAALASEFIDEHALKPERLRNLQRLDYLRQSLKDIELILQTIGPRLVWQNGYTPVEAELREVVTMHSSVDCIFPPQRVRDEGNDQDAEFWL